MTLISDSSGEGRLRVAVVGAGPSGFYAAVELLRSKKTQAIVDMFDRLPTPFGLVRNGVAPDHQHIKAVSRKYTTEVEGRQVRFRFWGHVRVGSDIGLQELRERYDAVILAHGAQTSRRLGIEGEDLARVYAASDFVSWYNGHPDAAAAQFDLTSDRVVVVGTGNVALDVARILTRPVSELGGTDIADHALRALRRSHVREVVILGRGGPHQASFTPEELRELTQIPDTDLVVKATDFKHCLGDELEPRVQRNLAIMRDEAKRAPTEGRKVIRLAFWSKTENIVGEVGVEAIRVRRTKPSATGTGIEGTDETVDIACGAVFRSIGYQVTPLEHVPFDHNQGEIPQLRGQVLRTPGGEPEPGLFVTGWAKRGARGIIGTNKPDALETVQQVIATHKEGKLPTPSPHARSVEQLLRERGVAFVTYSDWTLLDSVETSIGQSQGRPRRKFTSTDEMLAAIAEAKAQGNGSLHMAASG